MIEYIATTIGAILVFTIVFHDLVLKEVERACEVKFGRHNKLSAALIGGCVSGIITTTLIFFF